MKENEKNLEVAGRGVDYWTFLTPMEKRMMEIKLDKNILDHSAVQESFSKADGECGSQSFHPRRPTALRYWPWRECDGDFRLLVICIPHSCRHERCISMALHIRSCTQSHLNISNDSFVNLVSMVEPHDFLSLENDQTECKCVTVSGKNCLNFFTPLCQVPVRDSTSPRFSLLGHS